MATLAPSRRSSTSRTFRVVFLIQGYPYFVRPLRPHPEVAARAYRFTKPSGESYDVRVTVHGPECECMGFLRWGHCKHVRTLKAFGCY